jgi:molybdopterin molybdotransferase
MPVLMPYADALTRIAALDAIRAVERLPLAAARGRVLSEELVAREDLPPFDNSAMDGFAMRAAETAGASSKHPLRLRVGGTVFAGTPLPDYETSRAGTVRIMTGAPIPQGFDAVLRVEDSVVERDGDGERLVLATPVPSGSHVRRKGEDVAIGRRLVDAPAVLTPALLAVAAGQGIGEVDVVARPVLRFVATGDELVEDPNRRLGPGQIRNTSLPFLMAEAERLSLPAVREGLMPDREDEAVERVSRWMAERRGGGAGAVPHIVVSTGAVSVGEKDFVPSLVRRLGFEILVHGAAVRPGKPVLIAFHADAAMFWVGLPGNVLSTTAAFRFFVLPLLRTLLGLDPEPTRRCARLANDVTKPEGLRFFVRGTLRSAPDGALLFTPEDRQGSGMLSALASTDAYAVLPEGPAVVRAGTPVDVVGDEEGL